MRLLLSFLLIFLCSFAQAQRDTAFWFAAPEVSKDHRDTPILMKISTYKLPSKVELKQPANSSFSFNDSVYNLPPDTILEIDLTHEINNIENRYGDSVMNNGIHLKTTNAISAYYEVNAINRNVDIFSLKGRKSLGTRFTVPGQHTQDNYTYDSAKNAFDIVATQDNTNVTVILSEDTKNHSSGDTVKITLGPRPNTHFHS